MPPDSKLPPSDFIQSFANKLGDIFKNSPARDIEHNLKAGVTAMLGKLDMVTREEFDVQSEVLQRTRARLEALEARLAELEHAQAGTRAAPHATIETATPTDSAARG